MTKRTVAIGMLGTTLDQGKNPDRWQRWRPTVALAQSPDLKIDRLELLHGVQFTALALRVESDIKEVAPTIEVRRHLIEFKDPWDFEEVYSVLHDFARAFPFDVDTEDYLVNITTGTHVVQICWFLLMEAHILPGRILQLTPPKRWKDGSPGTHSIIDIDLSRYDKIAMRFDADQDQATSFLKSGIETKSAAFNSLIDRIEQVAIKSKAPLLLTGPTGAGKSQLARKIYELKHARHQIKGPFVEVNCATLRGDQAMSALFGHTKGAFTGATSDRPGLLRSANTGMLFLDEIGELGLDEQAMILRAIEEKRFLPVGADKEQASDFQLIAGTNRELKSAVADGRFREDLLARLDVWTFALPSLAERRDDIAPNLDFELARHARASGDNVTFNKEARERYLHFATAADAAWTSNFRDLGASITRMATLAPAGRINEAIVAEEIERLQSRWRSDSSGVAGEKGSALGAVLSPDAILRIDVFDRAQLETVIGVCQTSRTLSDAGRRLFSVSRQTKTSSNDADRLKKYLARFDLSFDRLRRAD
jgi:transcriptional regulatory protein RtcR